MWALQIPQKQRFAGTELRGTGRAWRERSAQQGWVRPGVALVNLAPLARAARRIVQRATDATVGGSNPSAGADPGGVWDIASVVDGRPQWNQLPHTGPSGVRHAAVAQLVERHLAMVKVAGSRPVCRSSGVRRGASTRATRCTVKPNRRDCRWETATSW